MSEQNAGNGPAVNTDVEIWRGPDEGNGDFYADNLFITKDGALGINCGGYVTVLPVREWHRLAQNTRAPSVGAGELTQDFAVAVGLIIGFVFADTQETRELCAKNAMPFLEKWTKARLDALASAPTAPGRDEGEPEHLGCVIRWKNGRREFHWFDEGNFTVEESCRVDPVYALSPSSAHPAQGLVKALEPFVALFEDYGEAIDGDTILAGRIQARRGEEGTPPRITFGDIRKVVTALSAQGKDDGCAAPFYSRQTAEKMTGLEEAEWIVKACREARDEGATDTRVSFRDDMVLVEGWKDFPASLPPPHFSSTPSREG